MLKILVYFGARFEVKVCKKKLIAWGNNFFPDDALLHYTIFWFSRRCCSLQENELVTYFFIIISCSSVY